MDKLDEAIEVLHDSDCTFWACPGAQEEITNMATCTPHYAYALLLEYRKEIND